MSFQYDQYLARHRANVKRGFDWLSENLPGLMTNTLTAGWNTEFAHDQSKNEPSLQPILKERHIPELKLIGLGTMQEAKNKDVRKLHF